MSDYCLLQVAPFLSHENERVPSIMTGIAGMLADYQEGWQLAYPGRDPREVGLLRGPQSPVLATAVCPNIAEESTAAGSSVTGLLFPCACR
jgi:hypothetical protein